MDFENKVSYLFISLCAKKYLLLENKINLTINDLLLFLKSTNYSLTKKSISKFLSEKDNKKIINFFWSDSIINPTTPKYAKSKTKK